MILTKRNMFMFPCQSQLVGWFLDVGEKGKYIYFFVRKTFDAAFGDGSCIQY